MNQPTGIKTKRFVMVLAAIAGIWAIELMCLGLFGRSPWLVDYVAVLATGAMLFLAITAPPLLLADRLARNVPKLYRSWVWLALAMAFTSTAWLFVFLVLRQFGVLA